MKRKVLIFYLLLTLIIACGKKGPPLLPLDNTPLEVKDLKISQQGERVVLTWTLPRMTADERPLSGFKEAEVYSFSQSLSSFGVFREELNLKEVLSERDWKNRFKDKAKKIFVINQSNKDKYVDKEKVHYEEDLQLSQKPIYFRKLFSFAVKTVSDKGNRSNWSNIVAIIPWNVPLPPQELKAEVKEEEIEISWQPPQGNIDGSQPANMIGYNIYRRSPKSWRTNRRNEKLIISGPQDWEYSNLCAIEILQEEEGDRILQLSVDKSTTSAHLHQNLAEEEEIFQVKGKSLDISLRARILQEEARGSILLDDGLNSWGSQNEKELSLTSQWQDYSFTYTVDEKATKLILYIKPNRYPANITFQLKKVEAKIKKEEEEEGERADLIKNGNFELMPENKFSDRNFEFGQRYIYSVRAVSRLWGINGESSSLAELEVVPLDTFPPLPPKGMSSITGAGIVSISWDANKEADLLGYNIYRKGKGEADFRLLNKTVLQKTIYQDDKVIPGKVYIYAITALDKAEPANESPNSEEIEIKAQ